MVPQMTEPRHEALTPAEFLPLAARRVLYVIALVGMAAAPVVAISQPDYAGAILTAAGVLNVAALGTALANPSR
jgi:hypothetical protein